MFFELYGRALQGASGADRVLDGDIDTWLDAVAEASTGAGVSRAGARARARLGIAVTRGLLDLLATGDVVGADAAMEAFIELYEAWLARPAD